jgi:apolipoprotein N-acyltransferase
MNYLLSLIGAWFGFANPIWHIPALVLLFPLALCLSAQRSFSWKQAFQKGWFTGWLAYTISLYWIALPIHNYAPLPWILAAPCPVLVGMYLGLYPALFTLAAYWAQKTFSWFFSGIFLGLVWICLEYIRNCFLTGFPWNSLAQAFGPWPTFLQSLQIFGAFVFTGILVTLISWLFFGWPQKKPLLLTVLITGTLWGYGFWQMHEQPPNVQTFSASIVQGNIEQGLKWDPTYQNATVNKYLDLSTYELEHNDPLYIFWPETAMPFYLQTSSPLTQKVRNFCRKYSVYIFTGAPGYTYYEEGKYKLYNRAYLFNPQGNLVDVYEKEHLVPFGEYVPLKYFFPFLQKIVVGASDFAPGEHTDPLQANHLALGSLICYEVIFPQVVKKRVDHGANVLVNLSNDTWFGKSSAPRQHLHQAILRAIENKRFIIRSTNTGISAFIDAHGRILKRSVLFQDDTLYIKTIPLLQKKTLFTQYSLRIIVVSFTLTAVLGFWGGIRPKITTSISTKNILQI